MAERRSYTEADYQRVMQIADANPGIGARAIERETGIPRSTIQGWIDETSRPATRPTQPPDIRRAPSSPVRPAPTIPAKKPANGWGAVIKPFYSPAAPVQHEADEYFEQSEEMTLYDGSRYMTRPMTENELARLGHGLTDRIGAGNASRLHPYLPPAEDAPVDEHNDLDTWGWMAEAIGRKLIAPPPEDVQPSDGGQVHVSYDFSNSPFDVCAFCSQPKQYCLCNSPYMYGNAYNYQVMEQAREEQAEQYRQHAKRAGSWVLIAAICLMVMIPIAFIFAGGSDDY